MFRQCLKIELRRGFHSISFLVAFLLAMVISISHIIFYIIPKYNMNFTSSSYKNEFVIPHSVFNCWIGGEYQSFQSVLYFMILPLLAVIPYGASYYLDCKRGYLKNLYTRSDRKKFLFANYLTTFFTAGVITVLPLVINLLICMILLPSIKPIACSALFPIHYMSMWSELYYQNPYLYILAFLLLDFIVVGFIACFALVVSFIVENRFMVLLLPFVLFFFLNAIAKFTFYPDFSPYYILQPYQIIPLNWHYVLLELLIAFAVSFCIFWWRGNKNDIF